ncbi:hypothetical protein SAMN05444392_101629 [Seinonella peptonophila]|uniref:Ribosomal processing cysteine protease Prp n=1 Tax=Seinonella peptonophila TaxID=112248 RepID=A0A1M4TT65_9BACL|nr:ribosomal-processing cysteine protease Prp [Seinonella peptonophila]SHE47642.1 hypothetical protein SAMN05444392_101629 [Seinonella peptonophila]
MIDIRVRRGHGDAITNVYISGHADFAEYGSDIVCSAVSGIAIGIVNAIEHLLSIDICPAPTSDGLLSIEVPSNLDQSSSEKLQLLLEAMIYSLQNIADGYTDFVKLQTEKR